MLVRIKRFLRARYENNEVTLECEVAQADPNVDFVLDARQAWAMSQGIDMALPLGPSHDEVLRSTEES